jgi:hypothetical protein
MDNHPVPQNISSYEFRLVGDMTLKQFLQLAAGIIMAVILVNLQLLPIIKYSLALISVLLGFLMAFIPINGRPFTSWLVAFFKAIYSPTEYIWIPDSALKPPAAATPPPQISAPNTVTGTVSPPVEPAPVSVLFSSATAPPPEPARIIEITPAAQVEPVVNAAMTTNSQILPVAPSPAPAPRPPPSPPKEAAPVIKNVSPTMPAAATVRYAPSLEKPQTSAVISAPMAPTTSLISPPTRPDILSGLIVDTSNQPLPGTTVEIVDTNTGIPARALRTNKLGQFQIAIPLPLGSYNVLVEKEGFTFDQVSIQIKGGIVPPVIVQAKKI